jgi:hypothetical protein
MAPVIKLCVAKLYPLHDLGKGDPPGFQKQMDVVGHQDVGIEGKPIALPVVLKSPEIAQSISLVSENLLPLITPDDDVIQSSFELHSGFSGHSRLCTTKTAKVQPQA